MKTIKFEGKELTAPLWVKYVAKDDDGVVFGYDQRPKWTGTV